MHVAAFVSRASAVLVLVALTSSASAAPARSVRPVYSLSAAASSGCPPARAFEEVVSKRLGRSPFSELAPVLLVVQVDRDDRGFVGRFHLRDEEGRVSGQREMRLAACPQLVDALGLAVSILLEPPAMSEGTIDDILRGLPAPATPVPETHPPPEPAPPPPVIVRRAVPRPAPPPRARRAALEVGVGPTGLADGLTRSGQDLTFGLNLSVGLVWQRAEVALGARASYPNTHQLGRGEVHAQLIVSSLLVCHRLSGLALCGVLTAGVLRAEATGYDDRRDILRPYVGPGARVGYTLGRRTVRLRPYINVELPLVRWRLAVEEGEALRPSLAAAAAGVDIVVHFP